MRYEWRNPSGLQKGGPVPGTIVDDSHVNRPSFQNAMVSRLAGQKLTFTPNRTMRGARIVVTKFALLAS